MSLDCKCSFPCPVSRAHAARAALLLGPFEPSCIVGPYGRFLGRGMPKGLAYWAANRVNMLAPDLLAMRAARRASRPFAFGRLFYDARPLPLP